MTMSAGSSLSVLLLVPALLSMFAVRMTMGFQLASPLSSSPSILERSSASTSGSNRHSRVTATSHLLAVAPLVLNDEDQEQHSQTIHHHHRGHGKIVEIKSKEEYLSFLAEDDRLCIVKFHAAWCKSCQKMGMQLQRIANEIADVEEQVDNNAHHNTVIQTGTVRIASVEYAANIELSKSLGITKLPTVLIYSKKELVDSFPCGPKKLAFLLQKISHYQALSLEQLAFEASMRQGTELGNAMLEKVLQNPQQQQTTHHKQETTVFTMQQKEQKPAKKWRRIVWPF